MAQLDGVIQFTGSLQNLSAYKMRGSDKIIIRKKGGPTKKQIKYSPGFENTRLNNKEFGGRAVAAACIKHCLRPLMFLADYNITGPLNALLRPIQKMDTKSVRGTRHILLSEQPRLLEGFSLNRRYMFDSIVRTPVMCSVQEKQVFIDLPALLPDINFMAPANYAWYQFIGVAGVLPDVHYNEHRYGFKDDLRCPSYYSHTNWLPVNASTPAGQLIINGLPEQKPDNCSIMVAVGIAFGQMQGNDIQPVKYVGGAKVMMMK